MVLETLNSHITVEGLNVELGTHDDIDWFDCIKFMTHEDLMQVICELQRHRQGENWGEFRTLAVALKCAFGNPPFALDLDLSADVWKGLARLLLEADLDKPNVSEVATAIMQTTILFPQKIKEVTFNEVIWEKIKAHTADCRKKSLWKPLIDVLFNVEIITSANLADIKVNIDEEAVQGILNDVLTTKDLRFAPLAAKVKALFPEDAQELRVGDRLLIGMKDYRKSRKWDQFGLLAANTIVLIADEVRIIDGSIKIQFVQPKTYSQELCPLPIQRNFP